MLLANPTTEEHYRKYNELASFTGFSPTTYCPVGDYDYLKEKYLEDQHLNNIPLKVWDNWGLWLNQRTPRLSIAELCCLGKHLVTYNILGAIPIFYESVFQNVLTSHGFKELSLVAGINYEKTVEHPGVYEAWAESTRNRFKEAGVSIL